MRSTRDVEEFFSHTRRVIDAGRLRLEAEFVQHGTTSTLLHSIAVAWRADAMACALGCTARLDEVRRAALLHDYYLYDWHVPCEQSVGHALHHGRTALVNALEDYPDLTERERNAIHRHMFPLNPPPRYSVGWFVVVADKACAGYETVARSGLTYPRLRELCARYLPDVELGGAPVTPMLLPRRGLFDGRSFF